MEEFVSKIFAGGKVTVPRQIRERFNLKDGDYVRLALIEVLKKDAGGKWSKKKVK